jgi:hypothetical protein
MATSARQEITGIFVGNGLSGADLDAALAHGQRRYEEGRDGERQRSGRFWGDVLAQMRSGVQPTIDADDMERLLRLAARA